MRSRREAGAARVAACLMAAAAAAGGLILRTEGAREAAPRPARAGWDLSRFHRTRDNLPDAYDVVFRLTLPDAGSVARAACSLAPDGSHCYAELSCRGVSLGKAGLGRETEMDSAAGGLEPGTEHDVRIVRRRGLFALAVGGELRCLLRDQFPSAGPGRASGGELRLGGSSRRIVFSGVRVRPAETEIAFGDDFMRAEDESSAWKELKGSWKVNSLRNPLLSANAFTYAAEGRDCLALTGSRAWAEYDFEASVQGPTEGRVGLVFCARSSEDHALFSWGARPEGRKELFLLKDGRAELVASAPGGYIPGVWYRTRVEVNMGRARVLVDGREAFDLSSPRLCGGEVGLWADASGVARFDDVLVTTRRDFGDSFAPPLAARWMLMGGEWEEAGDAGEGALARRGVLLRGSSAAAAEDGSCEGAKALWGGGEYRDVEIRARVEGGPGEAGLVLAYRDELNHVLCTRPLSRGRARLILVEEGERRILDEIECAGGGAELSLSMDRGHVLARLPGGVLEGWSEDLREGRVGVWARGSGVGFGEFRLTHHERPPQILGTNPIFGEEREMSRWADPSSDWYAGRAADVGSPWWNRGHFPGDCELVLAARRKDESPFEVALSVAKSGTTGARKYNGYVFKLSDAGVELHRDGEELAREDARPDGALGVRGKERPRDEGRDAPLRTVSLRRAGKFAVGSVNGEEVVAYRDASPPQGSKVAWAARGLDASPTRAMVFSNRVWDYDFSRAPCDWRPGAGVWEVTNRWECDSRWSFYSGRPEKGKKLAVLWNKRSFTGDVSVEFYACIKMEGARGRRYSWARDLNVTVCADGADLASGYSFLFGGFDNTKTCILRKGQIVASTEKGVIPRTNTIHRAWFYLRVEKRGSNISFKVDNGRVASLEYDDPEPLTGDSVAIWTYDCGMMVSRVRTSASAGGECEQVGATHGSPGCVYDDE